MVSVLIGKGWCRLGVHKVESWTYQLDKVCIQVGECQRCAAICERLYHQWGEYEYVRFACERCGEYSVESWDY